MTEREAWIAFSAFPQIGPARFTLIRKYFGSAKKAWKAPIKEYEKIGFRQKILEDFEKFRKKEFEIASYLLRIKALGIEVISSEDKDYPERLKNIADSPYILYVRNSSVSLGASPSIAGLREFAEVAVAVIGSRKMTSYGKEVTERLVTGLVNAGVTIVSGLALGIDSVAHRVAIENSGRTIAVLGGGLDSIYPPANRGLAQKMLSSGRGILVSEYPISYPSMPQNFPVRNRIVSGISQGVLVIEGAKKSGTLLTASSAASQGRDVFAVPGPITSYAAAAPNYLLKNGAKLVETAEDILEELDIKSKVKSQISKMILPETEDEKKIMEILAQDGLDVDNLVRISRMQTGQTLSALTNMELKGMVKCIGGIYTKI